MVVYIKQEPTKACLVSNSLLRKSSNFPAKTALILDKQKPAIFIAGFLDFKLGIKNRIMKTPDIWNAMICILLSSALKG